MFENGISVRRTVIWGVAALILFFVLIFIFRLLTSGSITVTTNNPDGIVSLKPLNVTTDSRNIKSASHTLSLRVKPGQYLISASINNLGVSKVVTVKARHSAKYTLNPPVPTSPEPVLSSDAISLAADSQQLIYVTSGGSLKRVDTSNNIQPYGNLLSIKAAAWASATLGVVQTVDNNLYVVNNGGAQPLQLPVQIPSSANSYISLSRNETLAFTNGGDVYSGKIGQAYKRIYTSKDERVRVAASDKNVAIIETLDGDKAKKGEGNDQVVVIDSSGKKTVKEMSAQQVGWSPSGKYLFVATEDNGNYIYDSSLNIVQTLVSTPFGAFSWINDSELAYGLGGDLWLYNVSGGQAFKTSAINGDDVRLIAASSDGSYVYVVTDHAAQENTGKISRIGLKNQHIPSYLQALGVFLPESIGVCALDYINFTKPTITVQYPAATTPADFCINAAKGELQYYSLNPDNFNFNASP